jgi:hypothetical protein
MAAVYSNGGNRWNILGFNFTKRDALSSVYKISMEIKRSNVPPSYENYETVNTKSTIYTEMFFCKIAKFT